MADIIDHINQRVTIRIPTVGEVVAGALIVFLGFNWWDERQDYRDLQEVAIGNANAVVACETTARKRLDGAEAKADTLLAAMRLAFGRTVE